MLPDDWLDAERLKRRWRTMSAMRMTWTLLQRMAGTALLFWGETLIAKGVSFKEDFMLIRLSPTLKT